MSDMHESGPGRPVPPPPPAEEPPLMVLPVPPAVLPPRRPRRPFSIFGAIVRWMLVMAFPVFCAFLFGLFVGWFGSSGIGESSLPLREQIYAGKTQALDKIAVVRIEGVIMEGATQYAQKQIEKAAADDQVKAVVVRINSPGGTITASDDLYHRLQELRDGTTPQNKSHLEKKLVVSMGSVAASGGYYIAMPAKYLMAEHTTITGSIGVYAAFPNIATLADKYGVRMEVIKAGDIKDSGSMFHKMTPQERHLWQDMVDHAYERFLTVVEEGRPEKFGNYWFARTLKQELKEETRTLPVDESGTGEPDKPEAGKTVTYVRRRADGGIFTADKALKYGLIDEIGYLEKAIEVAKQQAGLSDNFKAVMYEKPNTLVGALLGAQASPPAAAQFDLSRLAQGAVPRLWYLAPQCDLASLLTAACRE